MESYPRITIVTPSYNDARFLESTILSVVGQNYPNLEYIIMDGGSSDGSVEIIQKYEKHLAFWQSQPDNGMYDAIQKGFGRSTGEIMGWINSDDKHQPGSLFTLAQIFKDFKEIEWIQGTPTVVDELDRIFTDPHPYDVDKSFLYQRKHASTRKFIQQESTFWRRSLWMKAGGYLSTEYKYAGDFDLWIRFFQQAPLYNINVILGSFRQTRGGQASMDHMREYLNESFLILDRYPLPVDENRKLRYLSFAERFNNSLGVLHRRILNKLMRPSIFKDMLYFDSKEQKLKRR